LSTRPYAHSSLHNGNGAITIAATSTALPQYPVTYDETKFYIGKAFHIDPKRMDAMMSVIDSSQIKQRYLVNPPERTIEPRPLSEISREYQEHAVRLGRQVAEECLERAGMTPEDIDLIITVSCTGVMIPSLDAHLINLMGFRADVRRLPITELGCAAGAMALTRAWEYVRGFPDANVLIISVELASLTFQRGSLTQANLISSILFGDGAAAVIVTGRHVPGPRILDTTTYMFPDSLDAMGFDLRETGLHIVLSKDVPEMIRQKIKGLMTSFLGRHSLCREKVPAFVLHPGGQKLMMYVEEELGLKPEQTEFSWHVLREYGNLSSASVLFVLQEWMTKRNLGDGAYGVMASFGPGFSAELLLLQWP
jgi:alkylresorcinol/alkylpyrone synthase